MKNAVRAAVLSVMLMPSLVWAGSQSTSLSVSASVANNCTISTTALAFGPYDSIVAHASSPLDGTGTVTIACTKGAVTTVGLNTGGNAAGASGTTRAMSDGAVTPSFLSYEIYQDTTRLTVWGNSGGGLFNSGTAPSRDPRTFTAYGRVPGAQNVPAGSYADSVTATVNF